nr:hypothetical protein [Tanacetum cinerariifolium]
TVQEPPQNLDIHQLIEECSVEVPEQQKQKMEDTMFKLVKICHHKEFLCIHDDVDDLIESALNSKLLSINLINSQRLDKKEQEVKNVEEQPAGRRNQSNAENILPIPSKCEVTLEDEIECDMPAKDECSPFFTTFSNPLFKDDDDLDSKELNAEIADTIIKSIPLPIQVQDGNSQQEEIDIVTETDDVLPLSNENDDDLSNDLLLGEADLFLSDNSIPSEIPSG